MRRIGPDAWAGVVMLVIAVGVGAPVYLGLAGPTIPRLWWMAVFVATLAGIMATAVAGTTQRGYALLGLGAAALGSWILLITTPGMDMLAILMVLVAALAVYIVEFRWVLVLIAANSAVLGAHGAMHWDVANTVTMVGFYILIQLASALSCAAILREQQIRRELNAANLELRAANSLLAESARVAERLRISRDLHDSIGHDLTVLALELEAARHQDPSRSAEHIDRAGAVSRQLLGHVRDTVHELRSEPGDLDAVLRSVTSDIPGLEVVTRVSPDVAVSDAEQIALVRAVQEIVSNTIRHADGRELVITIERDSDGATVLTASDDGRGAADISNSLGNGLRGMIERFSSLGGQVDLDGSDGFRVTARVPAR